MPPPSDIRGALDQRFRLGHGRLVAALTRRFGVERFALVENAVQDAYVRALERWPVHGTPQEPERWLVRVAHNALIDALRRDVRMTALDDSYHADADANADAHAHANAGASVNAAKAANVANAANTANTANTARAADSDPPAFDSDDELRLMFLCCDPVLTRAAQVALVLNVTFGLSARQIAAAFVSDERTVAQRIVRAKQRLRDEGVCFDVPEPVALPARLAPLLDVLYIAFSEGYNPTGDAACDASLCQEALRLVRLLTDTASTARPTTFALRALLCFHASRAPARLADDGSLLLMPEQDRSRWDGALLAEAFACLADAGAGTELSRFHLEAAIAASHAVASSYSSTDWPRVVDLYDLLRACAPSLVVDVNRALAVAMCSGARVGIDELDAIPERDVLGRYPYALAAYADLHASLGNLDEAREYLDRALQHQPSPAQRALLTRKRAALDAHALPAFGPDSP